MLSNSFELCQGVRKVVFAKIQSKCILLLTRSVLIENSEQILIKGNVGGFSIYFDIAGEYIIEGLSTVIAVIRNILRVTTDADPRRKT